MTDDKYQTQWLDGSGATVDRTNRVINALIEWADKDGVNVLTRTNILEATEIFAGVGSDPTKKEYLERVVKHGPFQKKSPARWSIIWGEIDE